MIETILGTVAGVGLCLLLFAIIDPAFFMAFDQVVTYFNNRGKK